MSSENNSKINRDWQNFFTAEDFAELVGQYSLQRGVAFKEKDFEFIVLSLTNYSNRILREELAKAKRVYSFFPVSNAYWHQEQNKGGEMSDTHTALLIDEKEIEK